MLPRTSPLELSAPEGGLPEVEAEGGREIALRPEQRAGALAAPAGGEELGAIDVVLPMLHGPYGEDGTVQGRFELADLPYVGAGVLASALAMDTSMTKVVLAEAGIGQAPYLVVRERQWQADPEAVTRRVAEALRYPIFTKPARLGSSIGISKVKSPEELPGALAMAFTHDAKVLVEQGVVARELEVGVIGNQEPEASVVGEVVPGHEFYDFEGFARVDFFYVGSTGEVLVNEVNTIPGFTPKSMFPMLWDASGLPYPELVTRLVDLAVERHAAKKG